ncbi:hypothetical protein F5Y04DRAFT_277506 [Hypomontagnella monticulosa]|nr:hypothetical protein F5Y04DRAFT_277506 [Hypomontagnella monticulosa]
MSFSGSTQQPTTPLPAASSGTLRDEVMSIFHEMFGELRKNQELIVSRLADLDSKLTAASKDIRDIKQNITDAEPLRSTHPSPPKLHELDDNFYVWLQQMKAKMEEDGAAFGSDKARFHYVYSRLGLNVQRSVLSLAERAEKNDVWEYTAIFEVLSAEYRRIPRIRTGTFRGSA